MQRDFFDFYLVIKHGELTVGNKLQPPEVHGSDAAFI